MSNDSEPEVPDAPSARTDLATLFGRSSMPSEIRSAGGMRKLNWILGLPEPRTWIQELASSEFYLLTKDIGAADSGADGARVRGAATARASPRAPCQPVVTAKDTANRIATGRPDKLSFTYPDLWI